MKMWKILGFGTLSLALGLATQACSDDSSSSSSTTTDDDGSGGSGAAGGNGGSGATGGTGPTCEGPGQTYEDIDSAVGLIQGNITDLEGNPAVDVLSDVCGTNICLEGKTDTIGDFSTDGMGQSVIDVRLIYGTGRNYAQMTARIGDPTGFDFGAINTVELPAYADGAAIAAGGSATSNSVTLDVADGTNINFDIILYPTADEQTFRATVFTPADGTFPAIDPSANIQGLVATAPINTNFCPGAQLTLPNTFGFNADDELEVLYHGSTILTEYAPYGGWAPVAEAVVSSDGATISLKEGEGLEELGLFAFRLKP